MGSLQYPILKDINSGVSIMGDFKVLKASTKPLNEDTISKQLSKVDDSIYYIENIKYVLDNNIFLPLGVLNNLRRTLIDKMDSMYLEKYSDRKITYDYVFERKQLNYENKLIVKVETLDQFTISYKCGIRSFYIYGIELYKNIISKYKDIDAKLLIERINDEYNLYSNINNIVVNDFGLMNKPSFDVDTYLNVSNIYSINHYINSGASLITLSSELNESSILNIMNNYKKVFNTVPPLAVTIYDKVDLMIMKYCLISGHYKSDVGCNICRNNNYKLKDRLGNFNDIITTSNCRNRILNSKTLCLFKYTDDIKNSGIKVFRINFTNETKEECEKVLNTFYRKETLNGLKYTYGRYLK